MKSKLKWQLAGPLVLLVTIIICTLLFSVISTKTFLFPMTVIFAMLGTVGGIMLIGYGVAEKGTLDDLVKWMNKDG